MIRPSMELFEQSMLAFFQFGVLALQPLKPFERGFQGC